jgi:DNA-binding NarL/FixJ family response regulator
MKVLVVDDHPVIHRVMETLIPAALPNASVHGACDLAAGLALAGELGEPQLAILDLRLPGCAGLDSLLAFRGHFPSVPVVIFSSDDDPAGIHAALAEGAAGYIPKSTPPELIVTALKLVAQGGRYIPPQALQLTSCAPAQASLTARQKDVLRLIVRGCSNRRIAEELVVSENTVKQHVNGVFRALGACNRTQAVARAVRLGILLH